MSEIGYATRLWIVERNRSRVVLAQSIEDSIPDPLLPAPSLFRLTYVNTTDVMQADWAGSWASLSDRFAPLAVKLQSPDGVPTR
jgi:hypothetical protein